MYHRRMLGDQKTDADMCNDTRTQKFLDTENEEEEEAVSLCESGRCIGSLPSFPSHHCSPFSLFTPIRLSVHPLFMGNHEAEGLKAIS